MPRTKKVRRLRNLFIERVGLVDSPAIGKTFAILKCNAARNVGEDTSVEKAKDKYPYPYPYPSAEGPPSSLKKVIEGFVEEVESALEAGGLSASLKSALESAVKSAKRALDVWDKVGKAEGTDDMNETGAQTDETKEETQDTEATENAAQSSQPEENQSAQQEVDAQQLLDELENNPKKETFTAAEVAAMVAYASREAARYAAERAVQLMQEEEQGTA